MHIGFLRKMAGRSCEIRYEKQNAKKLNELRKLQKQA